MENIQDLRKEYKRESLSRKDLASNPIKQFKKWLNQASESNVPEFNAMSLATSSNNIPHSRIVLLKGIKENNFRFFTNFDSHKGSQITENPNCALLFHWVELERTVRIEGEAVRISEQESLDYFHSRPKSSQIGAVASNQSEVIPSRDFLQDKFNKITNPEKPHNWGGCDIIPNSIEFWQGRPSRLHDRFLYTKESTLWKIERLSP
jgi:pyridoxamine 5'-phosphate oxidase